MNTLIKATVVGLSAVLASEAFAGYNEYTSTVKDGIKDVTLTVNDTVISQKLSGDGVNTVRFTRDAATGAVKLRSSGGNDLPGGIISEGFMIKIQNPNVLGAGPLLLLNKWAGLYVDWQDTGSFVDVQNRVVFDGVDSYAAGQDAYGLTLHNVGVTANNADKVVTIGRENTGTANLTLALDGSQNDAIGKFNLRGNLSLTVDGGTLRAAAGSARDLFAKADSNATPKIKILNAPLTVDTAAGGVVRFGVAPTFAKTKSHEEKVEEYKPNNWSFEENSGWTFVNGSGSSGSGYYTNGGSFDNNGQYPTSHGSRYLMLRQGSTASETINVPTAGKWRVVFERGCRDAKSTWMKYSILIDDAVVTEFPYFTEVSGFTQMETGFVNLTAGQHKLTIALQAAPSDVYKSMNFDAIRFERYASVSPDFAIAKSGAGTLVINDFNQTDLPIEVKAGTLACENTVLPSATIAVASGAELNAAGLTAGGATIDVAAGGTFSLRALNGVDLIANGGFETPVTANYGFYWASSCSWNLEPSAEPRPGLQHNGGTYTASANQTPFGNQTLFLRTANSATQTVNVPANGEYVLSYWSSARKGYPSLALTVTVDGTEVVSGQTAGTDEYDCTTTKLTLTKGNHTIKFATAAGGHQYALMFIDNVSLVTADVNPSDLSTATLNLKSGSVVRLDNPEKVAVGAVTVDGVAVRGGAGALRAAGVMVEGAGRIQCGKPLGICIFVR